MSGASGDALPAASPEARAEFLLRLRARGIRDLALLRVLETLPRELFAPPLYADLASRDLALPIACGQTMSEPFLIARMMEALAPEPRSRVLEIGTGSGYATAVLARLCREVISVERYRGLAVQAQRRLDDLGIRNASVVWGDGMAVPDSAGSFDRLVVHATLDRLPETLLARLTGAAIATYATNDAALAGRQHLVRAVRVGDATFDMSPVCPSRLRGLGLGVSQDL